MESLTKSRRPVRPALLLRTAGLERALTPGSDSQTHSRLICSIAPDVTAYPSQVLATTAYFAGDRTCAADGDGGGCGSLRWAAVAMRKQLSPR